MGLFSRESHSFIINTAFTAGYVGGTPRTFDFYRQIQIHNIWFTAVVTTSGVFTIGFRNYSTTNNPYVASATGAYTLKEFVLRSWLLGVITFELKNPIVTDFISITPTTTIAVGNAVNVIFECSV